MNNYTKELLTENKKALRFLHGAKRFDFEKDYFITKLEGRFTYNSVTKIIRENITGEYEAMILIKPMEYGYKKDLHFTFVGNGKFEVSERVSAPYYYNIDSFYGVGDFEETRKHKTDHYYIIAQKAEYLAAPKENKGLDLSQRFRYIPSQWGERCGDGRGNTYIGKINLMLLDGSATKTEYSPYYQYCQETRSNNLHDIIDKSGYLVIERRRKWQNAANALRREREKAAAMAADFTEKENAIRAGIENAKMHIAETVLTATTAEDAKNMEKAVSNLRWLIFYFDRHTGYMQNKQYSSITAIERAITDLQDYISRIMGGLENA